MSDFNFTSSCPLCGEYHANGTYLYKGTEIIACPNISDGKVMFFGETEMKQKGFTLEQMKADSRIEVFGGVINIGNKMSTKIKPEDYGNKRWSEERILGNPWEFLPDELTAYTQAVAKQAAEKAWYSALANGQNISSTFESYWLSQQSAEQKDLEKQKE